MKVDKKFWDKYIVLLLKNSKKQPKDEFKRIKSMRKRVSALAAEDFVMLDEYTSRLDDVSKNSFNEKVSSLIAESDFVLSNDRMPLIRNNKGFILKSLDNDFSKTVGSIDKEFYDISSGSLLDYGNRYGVLNIYSNYLQYESNKINFIDSNIDFNKYSFDVFYNKYYNKSIYRNEKTFNDKKEEVTSLLSEINCYYFDGDYVSINKLVKKNKKLIELIKEKTSDYENSYVGSIIEVENKNQHSLIIKR